MDSPEVILRALLGLLWVALVIAVEFGLLGLVLRGSGHSRQHIARLALAVTGISLPLTVIVRTSALQESMFSTGLYTDIAVFGLVGMLVGLAFTKGPSRRDMLILHGLYLAFSLLLLGNQYLSEGLVPVTISACAGLLV